MQAEESLMSGAPATAAQPHRSGAARTRLCYLGGMATAFAAFTAVFGVWFWFTPWRFPPVVSVVALKLYSQKGELLAAVQPPRLLLIGGSSGLYGISAAQIEQQTGLSAFNFCTYSNLDLPYILHRAKQVLKPGDTALLCLEYAYYAHDFPQDATVGTVMLGDRNYFLHFSWGEKLLWTLSAPFPDSIASHFQPTGRLETVRGEAERTVQTSFNQHGDHQGHSRTRRTSADVHQVASSVPPVLGKLETSLHADCWRQVAGFTEWCRRHDIQVLATFPSLAHRPEYDSPEVRKILNRLADNYRSLGITVLGNPADTIWPEDEFYDTNYHLTEEAREKRTNLLVEQLRRQAGGI